MVLRFKRCITLSSSGGVPAGLSFPKVSTTTPTESDEVDSKDEDGSDGSAKKLKTNRDPLSHRVIEKRRRDRMNNCLSNLSKLIPSSYLRKGRGRIEKTEIIEMAIRYMRQLEAERKNSGGSVPQQKDECITTENPDYADVGGKRANQLERYHQGFYDCIAEMLRFLAGADGVPVSDSIKSRLMLHLRGYCSRVTSVLFKDVVEERLQPTPPYKQQTVAFDPSHPVKPELPSEEPLNMSLKVPALPMQSSGVITSQLRHMLESQGSEKLLVGSESDPGGPQSRPSIVVQAGPSHAFLRETHSVPSSLSVYPKGSSTSCAGSSSTQYPSSPGSGCSGPLDSPPRDISPNLTPLNPIFALHPSGLFYVPMSVHASTLNFPDEPPNQPISAQQPADILATCHPISIPVNFAYSLKYT